MLARASIAACEPSGTGMRAIFISYRRDDTEGHARTLFQDLVKEFGEQAVFMDVAGIAPGRDFRKVIDENTASCCVLLAIIGKNWISTTDDSGAPRLADPLDFVRLETASALKRDIPVIPVLVHGAHMPKAEQLPDDLKDLVFRNNVELTHARWDSDVRVLIHSLRPMVAAANREDSTPAALPAPASAPVPVPVPVPTHDAAASVHSGPAVMQSAALPAPANAAKRGTAWSVAVALVVAAIGGGGYIAFENRQRAQADAARQIEVERQAQADRAAEETRRVAQAASAAQAFRDASEARVAEDALKVAEARAAADASRAREANAARAARQASAQRAAEEARVAEDARKARDDAGSMQKQRDAQAAEAARQARSARILAVAAEEQRRAQLANASATCISGYVWREARLGDRVCVEPLVRTNTAAENSMAASRREPNGGAYGPDTCRQSYVWREAFSGDRVCVPPVARSRAAADNAAAARRVVR